MEDGRCPRCRSRRGFGGQRRGGRRQGRESRRADPRRLRRAARLLHHHRGLPARDAGNVGRGRNDRRMRRPRVRPCSARPSRGPVADAVRDAYARWEPGADGTGRGAIVGHRGGPPRRELRRTAGHLPQRRRHRRCARRRPPVLGVAVDRPGGRVPRRAGDRRHRSRARRRRAADGGCRVGGRAVHRRSGDGPPATGRPRRGTRPRRRGGVRRGRPRSLRRRHRNRPDPRPAARWRGRRLGAPA